MSMRDFRRLGIGRLGIGVLAVLLGVSANQPAAHAETIHFGAVLPLTGPAAVTGLQQMRGIQFAVDQANAAGGVRGNKIEVLFEDNQAKPKQSVRLFNRLADQQVPLIFTGWSGPSLAMAPLATSRKILLVNAGAQADSLAAASPYLINTIPSFGDEVKVISQYLISENKKRAAILFENDAAGIAGRDDFAKYFAAGGGTILSQERAAFGQSDYRPALLKLAAAKPDVMMVAITTGLQRMAQQYRRLGLDFTVAGTTLFAEPGAIADPSSDGFVHTQLRVDAPPELAVAFKAKFGAEMAFFSYQYYNATQIVLAVTDKTLDDGERLTGETMRETLFEIRKFQGLIPLEFSSNTATVPLDIKVMQGGKDVTIRQIGPR
jgi:branched-chain amino acid transport system substrate-binding protein